MYSFFEFTGFKKITFKVVLSSSKLEANSLWTKWVVIYITPRRRWKCYKKVCKSCTFYNRSTFFVVYFITSTLSLLAMYLLSYTLCLWLTRWRKKEAKSFLSLSLYKDFLLPKTHVTIDYHITDYKLSYFRLYLLINL